MGPPPPLPGATDVVAVSAGLVSTFTLTDDEVDGVVLVSELPLLLLPQPTASVSNAAPPPATSPSPIRVSILHACDPHFRCCDNLQYPA